MNEEKLSLELDAVIKKYKNLPLQDCETITNSFINEMAEVLSESSENFDEILEFFDAYPLEDRIKIVNE